MQTISLIDTNTPPAPYHHGTAFPSHGVPVADAPFPSTGEDAAARIDAPHSAVTITVAPMIAGLGRIERTSADRIVSAPTNRRKVIHVPSYSVNGGLDVKFDPEPRNAKPELHSLLTPDEYKDVVETLNGKLKPSRAKSVDVALLATGPLLVPLAMWGVRHQFLTKKRKRLLKEGIEDFNRRYKERQIKMHLNSHASSSSYLTIEEMEDHELAAARAVRAPSLGGAEPTPLLQVDDSETISSRWT